MEVETVRSYKPYDMNYNKNSIFKSKISLLCPTKNRINDVKELIRSIEGTVSKLQHVSIYFGIDHDDHESLKYIETLSKLKSYVNLIKLPNYDKWPGLGIIWNYMVQQTTEDIIGMVGDDMVFETPGWDSKIRDMFINGPSDRILLIHCNDGIHGPGNIKPLPDNKVAVNSFIHRTYCDITGYYMREELKHQYLDTWLTDVYEKLDRRQYLHNIMIRHKHHSVTGNIDNVTKNLRENSNYIKCSTIYNDLESIRHDEIKKIKEYINKHICLYNTFHNGDLYYSRDIIQNLIRRGYYITYYHREPDGCFEDIANLREERFHPDDLKNLREKWPKAHKSDPNHPEAGELRKTYLPWMSYHKKYGYNTWVYLHFKRSPHGISVCNWTMKRVQRYIFNRLNIIIDSDDEQTLPVINFKKLNTKVIKKIDDKILPLYKNYKKVVLISNGPTRSGQTWSMRNPNKKINENKVQHAYCNIIEQNPEMLFLITWKEGILNKLQSENNVIYTDDLTCGVRPDLLYIGYISLKCDVIMGYPSGPYVYTQIEENIKNSNKHFICICKRPMETLPHGQLSSASQLHISTKDESPLDEAIIIKYFKQLNNEEI
jgi:hypothetical protein